MNSDTAASTNPARNPWNKGQLVGPKAPLKLREVWAIRTHLQLSGRIHDLALFNLAIDSKHRGCDLVRLRVSDLTHGDCVVARAAVVQQKTGMPVRFEVTEQTRTAIKAWVRKLGLQPLSTFFQAASLNRHTCLPANMPAS